MTTFHLTTPHFDGKLPPVTFHEIEDGNQGLLVCYDLNNCLSELQSRLDAYSEILDVYLLESIYFLGKFHWRYFGDEQGIPAYGLQKHVLEFFSSHSVEPTGVSVIPDDFWVRLIAYARRLKRHVVEAGTWNHYQVVELPFSIALSKLTASGISLDGAALQRIREKADRAYQRILYALDVNNVGGSEIKDLNEWVRGYGFDEFLPPVNNDISIKDLSLLEDQHQVFKIFSRLNKLKRIKSFSNSIGDEGKIRPFYRTMGAVTGRCTSTSPNVMGIPRVFRPIVIPSRADFGIVECDYSQMEVGVAAALSNDHNLIDDFNTTDVYEKTGVLLFGNAGGGFRSKAKIIFLGIQYGLSRRTIARLLELSEEETSHILERLYGRYSSLSTYLASMEKAGEDNGFVTNISGLRRYRRDSERVLNYWEKNWFKNFPIQSSAASVFKRAITKMHQEFKQKPFHLLVPLYDSVVFECPLTELDEMTRRVVDCMVSSMTYYFPALKPKVSVNDANPGCWNSGSKGDTIETFLNDPLSDIDIREKPSSNVDWSKYF